MDIRVWVLGLAQLNLQDFHHHFHQLHIFVAHICRLTQLIKFIELKICNQLVTLLEK